MISDISVEKLAVGGLSSLISPFYKEQLQPHSYDLTLGGNFKEPSEEYHGVFENTNTEVYRLHSKTFALGHTEEVINIPEGYVGFVCGKSTIARNGLQIEAAGLLDCGFAGQVTLEFFNMSPWVLKLKKGMRICQLYVMKAEQSYLLYNKIGHYQNQTGAREPFYLL